MDVKKKSMCSNNQHWTISISTKQRHFQQFSILIKLTIHMLSVSNQCAFKKKRFHFSKL